MKKASACVTRHHAWSCGRVAVDFSSESCIELLDMLSRASAACSSAGRICEPTATGTAHRGHWPASQRLFRPMEPHRPARALRRVARRRVHPSRNAARRAK